MKDQPWDVNQTWPVGRKCQVVSIYKYPAKYWAQKHHILNHFFATSALDTAYLRNETSHRQTKKQVLISNVSPKRWLLSVTFDPETTETHWLNMTHLWTFSIFCHCRASHIKATEPRPTKFCHMLQGLRGLLFSLKFWGNSSPKSLHPV